MVTASKFIHFVRRCPYLTWGRRQVLGTPHDEARSASPELARSPEGAFPHTHRRHARCCGCGGSSRSIQTGRSELKRYPDKATSSARPDPGRNSHTKVDSVVTTCPPVARYPPLRVPLAWFEASSTHGGPMQRRTQIGVIGIAVRSFLATGMSRRYTSRDQCHPGDKVPK
jgi:hypothetical protein